MRRLSLIAIAVVVLGAVPPRTQTRIRVMLLDGQNNHRWAETTPVIKRLLDETGLFATSVVTVPNEQLGSFKPDWSEYKAVVMNYNTGITGDAPEWLPETKRSFQQYIANGGGLVSVHAADNGFARWPEFNEMIGVGGWGNRDERSGPLWYFKNDTLVKDETPGKSGTHGARLPFAVTVRDGGHPIMKGLPPLWMHAQDELYEKLRGPAEDMNILATAFASPEQKGTGRHEPILMTLEYGNGRIFHTVLGHADYSVKCVGFITTLQRGAEWAATGEVTVPVPKDFPTAEKSSSRTE